MKRGISDHKETQTVVLARMAATRAELVASSQHSKISAARTQTAGSASADAGPVFLRTPNAALIALVLVGSVIIGPRQILVISLRAGLTAWITRMARAIASGGS